MKKFTFLSMMLLGFGLASHAEGLEDLVFENGIVQISTAEDLKNFALAVNEGNTELDAALKADIDYEDFVKIGDIGDHKYAGTFDGKFHCITYNTEATASSFGLFGGLSGTIKNLKVDGSITTGTNKIGGIVGECFGGTIENCYSSVDIIGTAAIDACYAGILARSSASGVKVINCIYDGTIDAPEAGNMASIIGWAGDGCNATVTNCIFTGTILGDAAYPNENVSYTIARRPTVITVSNCFYVNEWVTYNEGSTQVTEEQVASGELCYLINGDQTEITWWQTLGTDLVPVPFSNSLQVYAAGNLDCTGQSADGSELTYSNTKTQDIPDHQYVDGICVICGKVDPSMASLVDGFYQIETADQFIWFANLVNQGNNTANAKLMDDIDLSGYEFSPIATSGSHYKGIFDGNYKTLTVNLTAETSSWGLFRYLDGTIQNLYLTGSLYTEWNKVGPLVGEIFGGKILNVVCDVEVTSGYAGDGAISGLVGRGSADGSLIENCIFAGNISGVNWNSAAFIGWSGSLSTLTNCAFTGIIDVDTSQGNSYTFARNPGNVTCNNCYYVNEFVAHQDNTIQVAAEDVTSGKLCYLLNGDQTQIVWNQTIEDSEIPVPFPTQERIYNAGDVYGNAYDAATYADFAQKVLDKEREYCEGLLAQKSLVENYQNELDALESCNNIDEFLAVWNNIAELRSSVKSCAAAYAAYKQKVEDTDKYLQEHDDFSGQKRDQLEDYLRTYEEPSSLYPRGTALYILEECELSEEEIIAETNKIDAMLEAAITEQPQAGTDMTMLLTNPTFKDGFNGWEGQVGTGYKGAEGSEMYAAECYNAQMDMYQTITGLANGVYEVQINGAFRPYPGADNLNNANYAAMFTANGLANYFQVLAEDAIPMSDAVDGINCNLTGEYPDYEVIDFDGEEGYVPRGLVGYCRAFESGRYQNSILANVTDGTLKIGVKVLGTGFENDALGFGNVKLFYHGELDQAGGALDNVLESQAARAFTMLNHYEYSLDEPAVYPNFSNEIKEKLQAAIDAVGTTVDNEAKLALVTEFSSLFEETYVCKKGYINLMQEYDKLNEIMDELAPFFTDDEMDEINPLLDQLLAYYEGEATTEEAGKDHLQSLSFMPKKVDGVYQLSTPVELLLFGRLVNAGETDANAVLTADIDASEADMKMISTVDNKYAGVFDGQGHTITYTMYANEEGVGLFRALTGTIKNLNVAGTIYTSMKKAGGIVAEIFGGTIQNCISSVNIESDFNDDAAYAGIAFRASATGCVIKDCLYTGTINAPMAFNMAGILGFTGSDCSSTVSNCLFMGTIIGEARATDYPSATISRNPSVSVVENCYYINGFGTPNEGSTEVTEEQIASGEVAFLLNGDQKNIQWTQTLPEDSYPIPYLTRGIVYANGALKCDGKTPVDGTEVSYSNTEGSTIEDHIFENGFCTGCGIPDLTMAELVDGYWQIGTAEQLVWFAKKVNYGDTKDNAQLTGDIELDGELMDEFPMIGTTSKKYEGEFDGRYNTITINKVNEVEGFGLFRALSGTVRNLRTAGTINTSAKRIGGIVCEIYGGTIENCESAVNIFSTFSGDALTGGIVGRGSGDNSVINNCLFSGTLKSETAWNCIPIVGWCGNVTYITNTLSAGKLEVSLYASGTPYSLARNPGNAKCTNCYFLNQMGEINEGSMQVTEEQLKNGEVCALLNAGQETEQWSQAAEFPIPFAGPDYEVGIRSIENGQMTIGNDAIYNLSGQRVNKAQKGIYIINGKKVLF